MLKSLLSLLFQSSCCLCQRSCEQILCHDCQTQVQTFRLSNPRFERDENLPLFAWGKYEGQLKQTLTKLKYERQEELGILLGQWLAQAWLDFGLNTNKVIVVPIPLHPNKQKMRGFNQAELIAKGFCQVTGDRLSSDGLVRIKDTPALYGLSPSQRKQNLDNAFAISKVWQRQQPQNPVLFIDDIYTTGTTIREAAIALQRQRIKVQGVAVIATPRLTF